MMRLGKILIVIALALVMGGVFGWFLRPIPNNNLSTQGELRLDLEELLRSKFGNKPVFISQGANFSCAGNYCSPLAKYSSYQYVFAPSNRPNSNPLRLSSFKTSQLSLGNYAVPVKILGKAVMCGKHRYLVELADSSSFALDCVLPLNG